jgi:hypothetical protein
MDGTSMTLWGILVYGLTGLASLLNSEKPITWRSIVASVLVAMVVGVIIASGMRHATDSPHLIFAVSVVAAWGDGTVLDYLKTVLQKSLKVWINQK